MKNLVKLKSKFARQEDQKSDQFLFLQASGVARLEGPKVTKSFHKLSEFARQEVQKGTQSTYIIYQCLPDKKNKTYQIYL